MVLSPFSSREHPLVPLVARTLRLHESPRYTVQGFVELLKVVPWTVLSVCIDKDIERFHKNDSARQFRRDGKSRIVRVAQDRTSLLDMVANHANLEHSLL